MGLSIRAFAREDGCSEGLVRKALKSGRLPALPDGTVDPALAGSGWRKANRRGSPQPAPGEGEPPAPPDLEALADRIVTVEGRAPYTLVEAERIKANYLAMLRQLQYDRESGLVAPVDEIAAAVAAEYGLVRNHMMGLPAKLAPQLAFLRDAEEIRALLESEITTILRELSLDGGTEPTRPVRTGNAKTRPSAQKGAKRGNQASA